MRLLALSLLLCLVSCLPMAAPLHLHATGGSAPTAPIPLDVVVRLGWRTVTLTTTLPGQGTFSCSAPAQAPAPADRLMAPLWDQVFGPGYFTAKVLGSRHHARYLLAGPQGRVLRLEMHDLPGAREGGGVEGVAEDDAHQLYKVGF